jgi:ethanolamine transporter
MNPITIVMVVFSMLAALDRIFGGKLGMGKEFERGIMMMGNVCLSMIGMIVISPFIADILDPVFSFVWDKLKIDPSVIPAILFANDMGGAPIAKELAADAVWGGYHGLIVASMMGVTICFTVPVALKTIDPKYHKEVLNGILCGIATIPVGCIVSGLMLRCSLGALLLNLIPVLLVSLITCLGLIFVPDLCRTVFGIIGKIVIIVITVGLAAGIFTHVTGVTLIPYMAPVTEGFETVCEIAIILAGVFPLIAVLSKLFSCLFARLGDRIHINEASVLGLISSLANSIPTFDLVDQMNSRGIVMNLAFAVSASFVFGDHLAFTMAFDRTYLPVMIVGKLTSGVCAVVVAYVLSRSMEAKEKKD